MSNTPQKNKIQQIFHSLRGQWNNRISIIVHNLLLWLFFSVIVTLFPLIFGSMVSYVKGLPIVDYYQDFLIRGELLLLSTAIGANTLGQIYIIHKKDSLVKLLLFVSCLSLVISSVFLFGIVSHLEPNEVADDFTNIEQVSIVILQLTLLVSAVSMITTEAKK